MVTVKPKYVAVAIFTGVALLFVVPSPSSPALLSPAVEVYGVIKIFGKLDRAAGVVAACAYTGPDHGGAGDRD